MKKILQNYNCKLKEEKIRIFFLIVIFLSMLNYWYAGDTNSTTRHGIELWDALFSGRFFQFYKVCEEAANEKDLCWHCAYYGMFIYLFVGIWNFPLYILEKLLNVNNILLFFPARIWAKLMYFILLVLFGNSIRKFAIKYGFNRANAEKYAIMAETSIFTIAIVGPVGQIDILAVLLMVISLLSLLEGNENKFFVYYVLSVQCKIFSYFFFLPIIFLKEKKVCKIILQSIVPLLIQFMIQIPFANVGENSTIQLEALLKDNNISIMGGKDVNLFFIIFFVILIISYVKEKPNNRDLCLLYSVWLGQLSLGMLLLFSNGLYYWFIYLVPGNILLFMMYVNDKEKRNRLIIVESILNIIFTLGHMYHSSFLFDLWLMKGMIVDKILPMKKFSIIGLTTFCEIVDTHGLKMYIGMFMASLVAWILILLICFNPRNIIKEQNDDVNIEEIPIQVVCCRAVINVVVINIALILYVIGIINNIISKI